MKRTERHHLKENELQLLTRQARETIAARQREVTGAIVVLAVVGIAALAYFLWRDRVEGRAHALLADAIVVQDARVVPPAAPGTTPPQPTAGTYPTDQARLEAALVKFKAAADAYPSTDAGLYARYQQGAVLMALNRPADAAACYQEVLKHAGNRIYSQMAQLGLAEAHARAGQYDQAINGFKELAQRKDGPLPVDGILMQLGRTYLDAGKPADAQQIFSRLVQEYPDSPFNAEARRELDGLKKT
jgi:tetratricopeptide (TPR) repeat protein